MTYHFIGLGGIGMSAIARILLQKGAKVQGSDMSKSLLLDELEREGAKVQIGHSIDAVKDAKVVVYSTGIKEDNVELLDAKKRALTILHRSDLLDELMKGKKNLLVSGTHGKTTTTALLASVLIEAGMDPSFVVGGLVRSLNTNGRAGIGEYFVAEADESDGSFLKSDAHVSIITSLSDDHLDYWGNAQALDAAFVRFMGQAKHYFWCFDDVRLKALNPKGTSYGFSEGADLKISHFKEKEEGIVFGLNGYSNIELSLHGKHNALNAAAVFGAALHLNIPEEAIRRAFRTFKGTARRLEFKGEEHRVSVYDDYGHHPKEIQATISALRGKTKERRLVVVFQPHRYTRVRDLFDQFTNCFQEADVVFLTDIYSAGEAPIEGISSAALFTRMREKLGSKLHFLPRNYLEAGVAAALKPFDVVLTMGAGDVTKTGEPILRSFATRKPKLKTALLFGGVSSEHAVSLMSMKNILSGLDPSLYDIVPFGITKDGEWVAGFDLAKREGTGKIPPAILEELSSCDVAIPVLHGQHGEDGMMGAVLDALAIPYVGCDYGSGAICMNKAWSKYAAIIHNVPTAGYIEAKAFSYRKDPKSVIDKVTFPAWVKPVHLGSSIGVTRVTNREELVETIEKAFHLDETILIEKEIVGREIEFAVLGNDYLQVALPGEIVSEGEFVAYDKKYGAGAMEIRVPAKLTEVEKAVGIELAETIYRACDCKGLARVDFFIDNQGYFWFNEINPFPGFTDTSAYPKMWSASGKTLSQLVDELIVLSLHKGRKTSEIAKNGALASG